MTAGDCGISISCYSGDMPLLKGCLESIRSNLVDLPICLITHGEFSTDQLTKTYGVSILRERDVDARLRANSYGYGWTKMVAFWHSPFERFLHIDADAVCWGAFLAGMPWQGYDLIYSEPHEVITDYIQRSQYFDPDQIFETYPYFRWEGSPFFNTGIFMARRGIFDIQEYLDLLAFQKSHPTALLCGEQGILNLMAFRQIASGVIRARSWPFQAVVPVIPTSELNARFQIVHGKPLVKEGDRRLVHWAGPKPYLTRAGPFPAPMVHYRLEHLRRTGSARRYFGRFGLMLEEIETGVKDTHGGSFVRAIRTKFWHLAKRALRKLGLLHPA